MRILADTHLLLWASDQPHRLSKLARSLLGDLENDLFFSPLSIWEVSIKGALGSAKPVYCTEFGPDAAAFQNANTATPFWNTYSDNLIGFTFSYAGGF